MKRKKLAKTLTSLPALAAAAWMGYNIFVKDYFPQVELPGTQSGWYVVQNAQPPFSLSRKITTLATIGITGKLPLIEGGG